MDRMFPVLLAKVTQTWKQTLFIVREDDLSLLALSENEFECFDAVGVRLMHGGNYENASSPL
jgi:hypothetical protein